VTPKNGLQRKRVRSAPLSAQVCVSSALSRQNYRQLMARFRASSGLFGKNLERAGNATTRWLCWQSAANSSPLVGFPDLRENTGKFRSSRLSARSRSPVNPGNSIGRIRFRCAIQQGIVQMEQGILRGKQGPHLLRPGKSLRCSVGSNPGGDLFKNVPTGS
jgi:hypothetical protein